MSPQLLALRTLMLARTRSVVAILMVAASLCLLDLFAGHIASVGARLEYQAVIGERLGHLTVLRSAQAGDTDASRLFAEAEAGKVRGIVQAAAGVALVLPQMRISGIASTGQRSALFHGEGVADLPETAPSALLALPGKVGSVRRNGIAVSSAQAQRLGLQNGSSVSLTGAGPHAAPQSVKAEVVDTYGGPDYGGPERADSQGALVMPLALAQSLHDTTGIERFVVFLSDPDKLEEQRAALAAALRADKLAVDVRTWQEQSPVYAQARGTSDLAFDSVAGMVFAVIAATIAATMSMNALERRREIGTLRALGMRSHAVFFMLVAEALGMALLGVAGSLAGSGLIAWIVNRAALSYSTVEPAGNAPMLVELDFNRMGMAVVMVVAVALLAALVPAFKAARAPVAPALAGQGAECRV